MYVNTLTVFENLLFEQCFISYHEHTLCIIPEVCNIMHKELLGVVHAVGSK